MSVEVSQKSFCKWVSREKLRREYLFWTKGLQCHGFYLLRLTQLCFGAGAGGKLLLLLLLRHQSSLFTVTFNVQCQILKLLTCSHLILSDCVNLLQQKLWLYHGGKTEHVFSNTCLSILRHMTLTHSLTHSYGIFLVCLVLCCLIPSAFDPFFFI